MNVFDFHVFELLKFAVHTSKESQLPNFKTLYIHKNSLPSIQSVCFNMFHVSEVPTEVSWQSKYRGTLFLNHLKFLHRKYKSIDEIETKKLIL